MQILGQSGVNINILTGYLSAVGREAVEKLILLEANQRVTVNLGEGVFVYEGVQSSEFRELTVWRMSLYGAVVGGDQKAPMDLCSNAYAITFRKGMASASRLVQLLGGSP